MTSKSVYALLFILLSLALRRVCGDDESCNRIDAAVVQDDTLYLFFGSEYVAFDPKSRRETGRGQIGDLYEGFPADSPVDAAMAVAGIGTSLLTGETYAAYKDGVPLHDDKENISRYLKDRPYFTDGIDAAASFATKNLFSKECYGLQEEAKQDGSEFSDFRLDDIGLPCSMDASVEYDNEIYWAKGEYVWIMDIPASFENNMQPDIAGPFCYASFLDTDYPLCKCKLS